ncbi:MAG: MG2 domain-containing protein, partial [Parabacteroides johnsonii]
MKSIRNLFLLLVSCFSIAGHSQNVSLELVYLQTDKGLYETGEDLWFKIYVMDAQSLALSERSKTLFVEMLNAKDSIVWQEKYPVLSGIAEGHMYIDKDLKEGDYRIHAYTRFSFLNDTLRPVYPKKIRVVKSIAYKGTNTPQDEDRPVARLSFFPEGGCLIDGIPTKVAFKARDEKGMPAKVKGVLQENGKEIARLETVHDGMGFVFMLPRKESSYKVVLDDGREFPFAEVTASGLSIHLRKQTDEYLE